ncbi:hypothetical protein ACOSP7_031878 [Xanthoceras sorbifolium]
MQDIDPVIFFLSETISSIFQIELLRVKLGFYGKLVVERDVHSWTLLKRLHGLSSLPWLCGGDWNEILYDSEKLGGGVRAPFLIDNVREAVGYCGLQDLGFFGPEFTWCNKREGVDLIQVRLDHCFCNLAWSDHRPILLEVLEERVALGPATIRRKKRFHFEFAWADLPKCKEAIKQSWVDHGRGVNSVIKNLEYCEEKLAGWYKLQRDSLASSIRAAQNELKGLSCSSNPTSWRNITIVETRLDDLMKREEVFWRQRSRVSWLKEGDKNTKFFHAKATSRKYCNNIVGLFDHVGTWHTSKVAMQHIVQDYFSHLFNSNHLSDEMIFQVVDSVDARVAPSSSRLLDRPFLAKEVRAALFEKGPSKAPGLDEFPAGFF